MSTYRIDPDEEVQRKSEEDYTTWYNRIRKLGYYPENPLPGESTAQWQKRMHEHPVSDPDNQQATPRSKSAAAFTWTRNATRALVNAALLLFLAGATTYLIATTLHKEDLLFKRNWIALVTVGIAILYMEFISPTFVDRINRNTRKFAHIGIAVICAIGIVVTIWINLPVHVQDVVANFIRTVGPWFLLVVGWIVFLIVRTRQPKPGKSLFETVGYENTPASPTSSSTLPNTPRRRRE